MSFLGEDENNKHAPRAFTEAEKGSGKSIFIPAIANFSAQYNLQVWLIVSCLLVLSWGSSVSAQPVIYLAVIMLCSSH